MKKIYTEKEIEDLFRKGIRSLQISDDVVLTDLAYEKAGRLGIQLVSDAADKPPAAPMRPYLSERKPPRPHATVDSVVQSVLTQPALTPALSQGERGSALETRIREAVIARLGTQVDAKLLDSIIKRTLKATGMK